MALCFPPSRTVMFVFGGSARPSILAVTYRNSITRTLLLLCLLLSLLVLVWVTLSGTAARRIGYRAYRGTALAVAVADLEHHAVIPAGTTWESEDLKQARVTTRWLWPNATEALSAVAAAAGVDIAFPVGGRHADVVGPVHIGRQTSGNPGLRPFWPEPERSCPYPLSPAIPVERNGTTK